MKRFLFLFCALALTGAVQASSSGEALTAQQISEQATAESKSLQTIERQSDGRVRMTAPMQAMEAVIGPSGMVLHSVDAGGDAAFSWRFEAVGRDTQLNTVTEAGEAIIQDERVALLRPQAIEEFTASADGIRQDFVILRPPQSGEGELLLELEVDGATLENLPGNDQTVLLRMADGRELHYHALHVSDANGRELPARMHAQTDMRLRIAVDDTGAQYPIRVDPTFSDADWTAIAGPDFNGSIRATILGGGDLYVGGDFTTSPNGPANHIARWDGSAWSVLGDGMNDSVNALAWDADNGHLYAGGWFISAGVNSASYIARWDGTAWSALGSGNGFAVSALAWDAGNGHLYAGGRVNPGRGIARWDGSAWSVLGDGMNDIVNALAWDADNGHLYAGGRFISAGGAPANHIARWDGTGWSVLGDGMNYQVHALAWDADNGHLYAGGRFTSAGGKAANHIARWDGTAWSALVDGISGDTYPDVSEVHALTWDAENGHLYAAGQFSTAGGNSANNIARWDGSTWSALGSGMNDYVLALAWDAGNAYLYAGGGFTSAGGNSAGGIARWDDADWSALPGKGTNGSVNTLAWDADNGFLYAGGSFTFINGNPANYIARWDGAEWSGLGDGMNSGVSVLAWDADNGNLYAGGYFTFAGGNPAKRIARWDGAEWSALGDGMDDYVSALAWDADNRHLYAGGFFTSAGDNPANNIARWDGKDWSALDSGTGGAVYGLVWDAGNEHLYAGGWFYSAGGNSVNHIARWDGIDWSTLGGGVSRDIQLGVPVTAVAWDAANSHLYVGGWFTSAGGNPANRIARWDGTDWSALGDGISCSIFSFSCSVALVWDPNKGHLYVGGDFPSAGGSSANRIARWDGAEWSAVGSGTNGIVYGLAWDADNKQLYASGGFSIAGGQPARVARLDARADQDPPLILTATPDAIQDGHQSTLSVMGGAGTGAVSYAVTAGAEFCSVSGDILTGIGFGTCTVTATKAGDGDYRPSSDGVDVIVHALFRDRFEGM